MVGAMTIRLGQRVRNEQGRLARIGGFVCNATGQVWAVTSHLPFVGSLGVNILDTETGQQIGRVEQLPIEVRSHRSIVDAIMLIRLEGIAPNLTSASRRSQAPAGVAEVASLLGHELTKFGATQNSTAKVTTLHSVMHVDYRMSGRKEYYQDGIEIELPTGGEIENDEAGTLYLNAAIEAVGILVAASATHAYLAPLEAFLSRHRLSLVLPSNVGAGLEARVQAEKAERDNEDPGPEFGPPPKFKRAA